MANQTDTWKLIHAERRALADTLDDLTPEQWAAPSLCSGWTVQITAGHVVAGAEQTGPNFFGGMAKSGFRFNTMVDRDARRLGQLPAAEIISRLRARTTTTNHPPAPVMAMLGEVVVHGEDIRLPLGISSAVPDEATVACLDMFKAGNFPVGGKKRVEGIRLVATDLDWSWGAGPEVTGPALALLVAMTGRRSDAASLSGDGMGVLQSRLVTA
jgi:uncharacterized protein (TIGR03083 family)